MHLQQQQLVLLLREPHSQWTQMHLQPLHALRRLLLLVKLTLQLYHSQQRQLMLSQQLQNLQLQRQRMLLLVVQPHLLMAWMLISQQSLLLLHNLPRLLHLQLQQQRQQEVQVPQLRLQLRLQRLLQRRQQLSRRLSGSANASSSVRRMRGCQHWPRGLWLKPWRQSPSAETWTQTWT
jgi:hypothetical protein